MLCTPVKFIVHTLGEVNDGPAYDRDCFMDVGENGIALYQSENSQLHQPKPKTLEQPLCTPKKYFKE